MRPATVFASILAFAASALAQDATPGYAALTSPARDEIVASGKTFNIVWSAGKYSGPATIVLLGGKDMGTLEPLGNIATGVEVKDQSYAWAVNCSLGEKATYGLKVISEASPSVFQWSFPFHIKGPSCKDTSSSTISSASSSSTGSSGSGYPTASSSVTVSSSSATKTASSTSTESSSTVKSTPTTLATYTSSAVVVPTTEVTVTQAPTVTRSSSSTPAGASSTGSPSPLPTAGAARTGAGLALGLLAAALAL